MIHLRTHQFDTRLKLDPLEHKILIGQLNDEHSKWFRPQLTDHEI